MQGERLAPLVLLGAALLATLTLPRTWPRDQTIHYVLGDRAGHVERVDAHWAAETDPGESLREVSFRYAPGTAPRVVTHEPRLSNGDYTVDVDIVADGRPTRYVRRVMLGGGVTSIDLTAGGASQ
jgi:hypothetical protein